MMPTLFDRLSLVLSEDRTVLVVIVIQTLIHHEGAQDLGTHTRSCNPYCLFLNCSNLERTRPWKVSLYLDRRMCTIILFSYFIINFLFINLFKTVIFWISDRAKTGNVGLYILALIFDLAFSANSR